MSTYRTHAQWNSGMRGSAEMGSEVPAINFSAPPEFHGEAGFWTPEHLLVAAVATCFINTFRVIATLSKFEFMGLQVTTEGSLEKAEGGLQFTRILLKPTLNIASEREQERGLRLLEKAKQSCLISRSLKSEVTMLAKVLIAVPMKPALGGELVVSTQN